VVAVTPLPSANMDPLVCKSQILSICTHIENLKIVKTKDCCWLLLLVGKIMLREGLLYLIVALS
jgi:hypothetical protein